MATSENEKIDDTKEESELEQRIEKIAQKNAGLNQEIATESNRLYEETDALTKESQKLHSELKREFEELSKTLIEYKKQAADLANQLLDKCQETIKWTESFFENVKKNIYVIFAISLPILILGYFYFSGLTLNFDVIVLVIFIFGFLILVNITLGEMHKKIRKEQKQIELIAQKAIVEASSFIARKLKTNTDTSNAEEKVSTVINVSQKIGAAIRSYIPGLKEFFEGKNNLYRLNIFTSSLRNSFKLFGIEIDAQTEKYLRVFGSLANDRDEWLEKAKKDISQKLDIPTQIISLAFYEYTNDIQNKRNEWKEILEKPAILLKLSKLLCNNKLVNVQFFDIRASNSYGSVEEILKKLEIFSLENFRSIYYDFYGELLRQKRNVLFALHEYSFKLDPSVENEIMKFVPETINREQWTINLLDKTAKLMSANKEIIELIFWDRIGEHGQRKKSWEMMIKEKRIECLIELLLKNGLLKVPDHYEKSPKINLFISNVLKQQSDYNLLSFTKNLSDTFHELDVYKKQLLQTIANYGFFLSEVERNDYISFLPQLSEFKEALIKYIHERFSINDRILTLLHLNYIQQHLERKTLFYEIVSSNLVEDLAKFLLTKNIVETEEKREDAVDHLVIILGSIDDFDLSMIQTLYQRYNTLMKYTIGLTTFLHVENITVKKASVEFKEMQQILRKQMKKDIYQQLKIIIKFLMIREQQFLDSTSEENQKAIVIAIATLFLSHQQDPNATKACHEAAHITVTKKILYQYIKLSQEKSLGVKSIFLKDIVLGVLTNQYKKFEFIAEFESRLASGWLYSDLGELLSARMSQIKGQNRKAELLEKALKRIEKTVKEFINAELEEDAVLTLLNAQVISAYLITTRSRKPVIRGVIDGTLVDLCNALAIKNPLYQKFLLLDSKIRVTGGLYTRIGLIPPSMSFEEFSDKFQRLFTEASQNYISVNDLDDNIGDYSVHLVKIFPSDVAFKLVKAGLKSMDEKLSPQHPVHVIKKLMIEKLGLATNLEFVASMNGKEPRTIAFKNVITTLVNTKTSTYVLTKNALASILPKHPSLRKKMKERVFDAHLISKYGYDSFSELSINLHRNYQGASPKEKVILKAKFHENIAKIVSEFKSRLDEDELYLLSNSLFKMLDVFGTVLKA